MKPVGDGGNLVTTLMFLSLGFCVLEWLFMGSFVK
jgi:hypothetical protein